MKISTEPMTKSGTLAPIAPTTRAASSPLRPARRIPEATPRGSPTSSARPKAMKASSRVTGARRRNSWITGFCVTIETPKSPCSNAISQRPYCTATG